MKDYPWGETYIFLECLRLNLLTTGLGENPCKSFDVSTPKTRWNLASLTPLMSRLAVACDSPVDLFFQGVLNEDREDY